MPISGSNKIKFDYSAKAHLFCIENRAIDILLKELDRLEYTPENIQVLQLGAIKVKHNLNIKQFYSIENLQTELVKILDRAKMGVRFYAIGSEQFIWNLRGYARNFGLSNAEISLQAIDSKAKNIYCSNCQTINHLVEANILTCDNCDIKLEVLEHFSPLKNAYLGICVDADRN